jgi:mRNA-degrading endonuclease RelE of RelBE toxin-antitoxin system
MHGEIVEFRIADTFTDSLTRLTGDEQKAVKTTAFDLQLNPAAPGMRFHKLDKAKDKNFWSVRVSADVRIIVHKADNSLLLCYVDHHDAAYAWAERRKLQTHPKTGAAQLVEIRETVQEIFVPTYIEGAAPKRHGVKAPLFASLSDEEILGVGVPDEWLADVRAATEDTLLGLTDHLPSEAAEALLQLATGGRPRVLDPARAEVDPFSHPDAQRRFRVMANIEELARALDYPWDKWTVFLHPDQRQFVEGTYSGPARVAGSAGTGKTIVALHRAAHLARDNPDARVLLTTFSDALASALQTRLNRLVSSEPRLAERIDVHSLAKHMADQSNVPFDFAVVDEAQDLSVSQLRFLAAIGKNRPDALFFAGDLGQRIFQQPFSWKSLGVDVRGRSRTLRVNYRTSHQIRMQADHLLGPSVDDVDGNTEDRSDTVSVFNGPPPVVRRFGSEGDETAAVAGWIAERIADGVVPHEIGLFVRSGGQLERAKSVAATTGLPYKVLDERNSDAGQLAICTMHLAKGLEFRSVAVMACDDEIIPLQERIESIGDDADLQEVYDTERHLLYVACTRARDHLLITSVEPGSEFLDDLSLKDRKSTVGNIK